MERRAFLAAALGAVASACTRGRPAPSPSPSSATPSPSPTVDPDVALLTSWWLSERRLLDGIPPSFAPLRAHHSARLAAVGEHLAARGAPLPVPPLAARIADVAKAERDAVARYLADVGRVASADLAVLGAELAAGAKQHATVLALTAVRR